MIEAIFGRSRANLALCKCDVCASEVTIPALHGTGDKPAGKGRTVRPVIDNVGAVHTKLQGLGWVIVKGKLRCPHCEAKRRALSNRIEAAIKAELQQKREVIMSENGTELRQPTREQRRDIRAALDLNYDMKAEQYIGGETDLTIAQQVGGGCMPGWVADIRDLDYGPAGGNEQIVKVAAEIEALDGKVKLAEGRAAAALSDAATLQKDVIGIKAEITALQKSIGIIKTAVGPKAARA